jgi:phosphinothricin acetyltransferase
MPSPTLRDATVSDLDAINAIYNHYVLSSTCTFQIAPESPESRAAWFANRSPTHPVIVAEAAGEIIAWGSLSPFHKREAFAATAENSIYVHHLHLRRGLGSLLLNALILRARSANLLSIVAAISSDQPGSIALHQSHGFSESGRLLEVGQKFGKTLDIVYLQLFPTRLPAQPS